MTDIFAKSSSFRLSPLIQITLISLYLALTIPLPFLAQFTQSPISPLILWVGIVIGLVILIAFLSEKVVLDEAKIEVCYPRWIPSQFRRGWSLNWTEIQDLKLRTTGQGGLVYYFVTPKGDRAYLLPMRVAGFSRLVEMIQAKTGIDTKDIRPLAQPWMYLTLLVFTVFLWLMDGWTIWTAMTQVV
jgi:hypothetical protein